MYATEGLSASFVHQLKTHAPTAEEMTALNVYKDEPSKLAKSDQFCLTLGQIPKLVPRLDAMLMKLEFEEKFDSAKAELKSVIVASTVLVESKELMRFMELVLLIGNYMNSGGHNAGSHGFRISFLNKLANTKTSDNTSSLLHYVITLLQSKDPDVLDVVNNLDCCLPASRVTLSILSSEIRGLSLGVKRMTGLLESLRQEETTANGDKFVEVMTPFEASAKKSVEDLETSQKNMMTKFQDTCKFFGEDPSDIEPQELFGVFVNLIASIEKAQKDIIKAAEVKRRQEAREKAEKEKQEKREQKLKGKADKRERRTIDPSQEKGIMDDLFKELKDGSRGNGRNRRQRAQAGVSGDSKC